MRHSLHTNFSNAVDSALGGLGEDMPLTVAVDSNGTSAHESNSSEWAKKIKAKFLSVIR